MANSGSGPFIRYQRLGSRTSRGRGGGGVYGSLIITCLQVGQRTACEHQAAQDKVGGARRGTAGQVRRQQTRRDAQPIQAIIIRGEGSFSTSPRIHRPRLQYKGAVQATVQGCCAGPQDKVEVQCRSTGPHLSVRVSSCPARSTMTERLLPTRIWAAYAVQAIRSVPLCMCGRNRAGGRWV